MEVCKRKRKILLPNPVEKSQRLSPLKKLWRRKSRYFHVEPTGFYFEPYPFREKQSNNGESGALLSQSLLKNRNGHLFLKRNGAVNGCGGCNIFIVKFGLSVSPSEKKGIKMIKERKKNKVSPL